MTWGVSKQRKFIAQLQNEAKKKVRSLPDALEELPFDKWPTQINGEAKRVRVWVSKLWIVQLFEEQHGFTRLSVNRTSVDATGRFADAITWDELQAVKRACGYGEVNAVELYPRDAELVNVSNIRHLWLLAEDPIFMWKDKK